MLSANTLLATIAGPPQLSICETHTQQPRNNTQQNTPQKVEKATSVPLYDKSGLLCFLEVLWTHGVALEVDLVATDGRNPHAGVVLDDRVHNVHIVPAPRR